MLRKTINTDEASLYLSKVNNGIAAADSKVATGLTIFPIIDLILTFLFVYNVKPISALWNNGENNFCYSFFVFGFFILFIFAFISSVFLYFFAVSPRFNGKVNKDKTNIDTTITNKDDIPKNQIFDNIINLNFYEDIALFTQIEYFIFYLNMYYDINESYYIMKEVYFNAKICHVKMHLFKWGLWISFASLIFGLIAVISLLFFAVQNQLF